MLDHYLDAFVKIRAASHLCAAEVCVSCRIAVALGSLTHCWHLFAVARVPWACRRVLGVSDTAKSSFGGRL